MSVKPTMISISYLTEATDLRFPIGYLGARAEPVMIALGFSVTPRRNSSVAAS